MALAGHWNLRFTNYDLRARAGGVERRFVLGPLAWRFLQTHCRGNAFVDFEGVHELFKLIALKADAIEADALRQEIVLSLRGPFSHFALFVITPRACEDMSCCAVEI